jgi:fucose permease
MAGLQLVILVAVWIRRRNWVADVPEGADDSAVPREASAWLLLTLFFLYTGVEVGTGQWSFTLLTESRGYGTAAAGAWVAIYWGGLTAGRFGLGFVGHRFGAIPTLHGSVAISLVGLAILWVDPAGLGVIGLPITSLGLAAIFPTMIAVTPARLGSERSTRSIGHQLAAANLGVAAIPWLLGLVAEGFGVPALAPGLFFAGLILAILHVVSVREAAASGEVV